MRIIIEIDGGSVVATTVHPDVASAALSAVPAAPTAPARPTAPPEVLTAAAALRASDAGPSPWEVAARGGPLVPTPWTGRGALAAEPGDTPAGPAPAAPPEILNNAASVGATDAGAAPTEPAA